MEDMDEYEKYRYNRSMQDSGLWFAFGDDPEEEMFRRSSYSPEKKIILESIEGDTFEVEETVALESQAIREYVEGEEEPKEPFATIITAKMMPKVIEYLKRHVDVEAKSEEDLKKFDADFVKGLDRATFSKLSMAAQDLQIKSLYMLILQANKIPGNARTNAKVEAVRRYISGKEMLKGKTPASEMSSSSSKEIIGDSGNTLTPKKRNEEELSDDSSKDSKRQKAATNEDEE